MSKNILRKDKTCLNCRHVVDQRFCPNCGQENTDSRKTFHHLFVHFFEDLTHYENAFWRTIKNLIFKPAALTKEYLSGRRLSYLAPVRLYIFISFVTFFMITVIPDSEDKFVKANQTTSYADEQGQVRDSVVTAMKDLRNVLKIQDSLEQLPDSLKVDSMKTTVTAFGKKQNTNPFDFFGYKSVRELDSLQKIAPPEEKLGEYGYWFCKKFTYVREHNTRDEIFDKFKESFLHNFPKVLFIYMPLFAFFLWLFHSKKRWYYFDHGIFTLHYFSFLLLIILLLLLIESLLGFGGEDGFFGILSGIIHFIGIVWMFYYFFPAHHRFYGESRIVSFLKSMILFFINCILILILLTIFAIYTFINIH